MENINTKVATAMETMSKCCMCGSVEKFDDDP